MTPLLDIILEKSSCLRIASGFHDIFGLMAYACLFIHKIWVNFYIHNYFIYAYLTKYEIMKYLLVLLRSRGFHHCHSKNKTVQIGKPMLSTFSLVAVS